MAELEEEIIMEMPETGGEPEPKLKESDRKRLDSIVSKMIENGEDEKAISYVVEDFKKKYATKPLVPAPRKTEPTLSAAPETKQKIEIPKIDFTKPVFEKRISESTAPVTSIERTAQIVAEKPPTETLKEKVARQKRKAEQNIVKELGESDASIEKMIREHRFEMAGRIKSEELGAQNLSDQPATIAPVDMGELAPEELRPQELPVTPEQIKEMKDDAHMSEQVARHVLGGIKRHNPEKKKQIEKSVYQLDAFNSVENDPNGEARLPKILENAKRIGKGQLEYDENRGVLYEPQGVVGSFLEGWKQKSKLFDDYSFFNNKTDEEIISELEKRRTSFDPDTPIPIPKHKLSEASQMIGGTPVTPLVAGAAGSVVPVPGFGVAAATAVGAADFYKMGYAGTLQQVYGQLRAEGVEPAEALKRAQTQAKKEAAIDAATGGLMSAVGARIGAKPLNFSQGFRTAAFDFLKRAGGEGAVMGALGGGSQALKNELAKAAGIEREADEGVLDQIEGNFLMTVGVAAAARLGKGLSPKSYRTLLNGLKGIDKKVIENTLVQELEAGRITEPAAENVRKELDNYRQFDSQIPANIAEEARIDIQEKIEKRNELEAQKEKTNKAFHPEIKEKIDKLDEEIQELSKQREKKQAVPKEQKQATEAIETAIEEGALTGVMAEMAKENPEGFMKFIADQSIGRTEEGVIHEAGGAEIQLREQLGDELVDAAKKMYPIEEKKSSVSVIRPEEQKQTETITIKPTQDAVEVKSTDALDVREQAADGGKVGEGDTKSQSITREEKIGEEGNVTSEAEVIPPEGGKAGVYVERPGTELSHRGLQNVANEFSLPDVEKRTKKSDLELRKEATDRANKWAQDGTYFKNIESLTKKAEKGDVLTDTERVIMEQHLANLTDKARSIENKNSPEYKEVFEQIKRLKLAGEKTRSEAGAALRLPTFRSTPTGTLEDALIAKQEAIGKETLTPEEQTKTVSQFEKIEKTKKTYTEKAKVLADRIRALRPKQDGAKAQFFGLPLAIYDTAIVTVANAIEAGAQLADAIQLGIDYVRQNGGFKNKKDEKGFKAYMKGELTYDERLESFKRRTATQTEKLKEKTAAEDFEPEQTSFLELDEEARKAKAEYRDAKYKFELELQKDQLKNRPLQQKVIDAVLEPPRAVRTILTSFDFSAPLRQGLIPTVSHPTLAAKAFPEMFKQAFSEGRFNERIADLKESPFYEIMEKSDLYISDPNNPVLSAKEENFMSNIAGKIPIIGQLIKGSERAYSGYLNEMRTGLFKQGVEQFLKDGKTMQNSPELYKGLASFINNATGRGKLGPLEGSAQFLNTVFFSPRLMASRVNMLGLSDVFTAGQKGFYSQLPKEVRIMAMKDMLKFIGFGMSVLGLAKIAGADVEGDPRSSDFGKIKVGNSRWDIWGGFQQYVRLIAQMATGEMKETTSGEIKELKPEKRFGERPLSFLRSKLAPVPGGAIDIGMEKNMVGEEVTWGSKGIELVTPMIYRDVKEAMKEQGIKALFTVGVPATFGVGTSTYTPKETKSKSSGRQGKKNTRKGRTSNR